MREYLLGGLSSDQMERVEELLITDDTFYDEVIALEDELIDRYIGDSLSDQDRARFESNFLTTPERHRQVSFARALKKYVSERPRPEEVIPDPPSGRGSWLGQFIANNRAMVLAVVAVFLLAVSASVWLTLRNWRAGQFGSGPTVAATLIPGTNRGEGGQTTRVTIPADAGKLELSLQLRGATYGAYTAVVVNTDGGATVFTSGQLYPNLSETPPVVVVDFPAKFVPTGEDYQVILSGVTQQGLSEEIDRYNFRVPK